MTSFPPSFDLIGELVEIDFKNPTEMQPKPSALVSVKYGRERLWSNDAEVNFVNEIYVKLPFNTYSNRIDKLTRGAVLRIKGRLQSIQKQSDDAPRVELVAEVVAFSTASEKR